MLDRLKLCARAWLVALDQLAFVTIVSLFAIVRLAPVPSPYETISSFVGRRANAGARWAAIAQRWIDDLFQLLGSRPGHCQRSIVRADLLIF